MGGNQCDVWSAQACTADNIRRCRRQKKKKKKNCPYHLQSTGKIVVGMIARAQVG